MTNVSFIKTRLLAHGFIVTDDIAIVQHKIDDCYQPEPGVRIQSHDPDLAIPRPLLAEEHLRPQKDMFLPFF